MWFEFKSPQFVEEYGFQEVVYLRDVCGRNLASYLSSFLRLRGMAGIEGLEFRE